MSSNALKSETSLRTHSLPILTPKITACHSNHFHCKITSNPLHIQTTYFNHIKIHPSLQTGKCIDKIRNITKKNHSVTIYLSPKEGKKTASLNPLRISRFSVSHSPKFLDLNFLQSIARVFCILRKMLYFDSGQGDAKSTPVHTRTATNLCSAPNHHFQAHTGANAITY